jgi:aminoglycoside 6'-N-acetyltransferase I
LLPFPELSHEQRDDMAAILMSALAHMPSAWHDLTEAAAEVASFDNPDRLALAVVEDGDVLGWIGAIIQSPHAWEIHPLVVRPNRQRCGHGTLLVNAIEALARRAGVSAIWVGTDDDFGGTNLYGRDLYPDVLGQLQALAPAASHAFTFYRRMGYAVVGVLPDANGYGKHDILMAKRIVAADS